MAEESPKMPPFLPLTPLLTGPRLGRFTLSNVVLNTPTFILPSSRGVIPHLSHDILRDHTSIRGVYVALEDFLEKYPPLIPSFNANSTLRTFTALPNTSLLLLSARRNPPIPTAATNTDDSIAILTSVGFRTLNLNLLLSHLPQLKPDVIISPPDIPSQAPGKGRVPKMLYRTEKWLSSILPRASEAGCEVFASVLPLDIELQRLYLSYLSDSATSLAGLALYDSSLAPLLPEELSGLIRLSMDEPGTPLKVLEEVERGVDLFSFSFPGEYTDAGIASTFKFPGGHVGEEKKEKKVLGINLWGEEYATDLGPLQDGCECYACRRHHRAFIRHLLNAREMTAWILLQIHNSHAIDRFFTSIRASIEADTFATDKATFTQTYEPQFPQKTGEGPRVRGYMFKSESGAKKRNPRGFEKRLQMPAGDRREALEEATPPPDVDESELVECGFAEKVDKDT
ncbi:hypothetical protein RUND412_009989 [Rhizina undulata]